MDFIDNYGDVLDVVLRASLWTDLYRGRIVGLLWLDLTTIRFGPYGPEPWSKNLNQDRIYGFGTGTKPEPVNIRF